MARIVLGLGTSHSPQLSIPAEAWRQRGEEDRRNQTLYRVPDGRHVNYDELMDGADAGILKQLDEDLMKRRHEQNQRGLKMVADALEEADPDVLVVIGDDQKEAFQDDNMPAFSVYWGDNVPFYPRHRNVGTQALTAQYYPTEAQQYPGQPQLALHIIDAMMDQGFDVAHSKYYNEGQSITHAVQFVTARILGDTQVPVIPVIQNTYFPPNQPRPFRSYAFGQALRNAVENWKDDLRVGIIASGGLSHFVVDEELDRGVLKAFETQDAKYLTSIPVERIQSGTSEIRNWITVAGAAQHLKATAIDYVPCYRSLAGTGCGMGFAKWS